MVKKVWRTDRQTDRQTDWTSHIAAWSQLKIIGHLFYTTSSFVYNFKSIGEFKLKLQSRNAQFGSKSAIFFVLCDLEIWWMTLENNRAPPVILIGLRPASFTQKNHKGRIITQALGSQGRIIFQQMKYIHHTCHNFIVSICKYFTWGHFLKFIQYLQRCIQLKIS